MRKKFLTMFLVGAMALSITACGGKEAEEASNTPSQPTVEQNVEENVTNDNQQETVVENEEVVENTEEEVLEGDAPLDDDVDSGTTGKETIDLTNTTEINIAEKWGKTLKLPVYTFAFFTDDGYGDNANYGYYRALNDYDEVYSLKIEHRAKLVNNGEEAYAHILEESEELKTYTHSGTDQSKFSDIQIIGDATSGRIVLAATSTIWVNGDSLETRDYYCIYDADTTCIYELELAIAKNAALYGEDVLERSTAVYREQLREAVIALAN